MKNKKTGKSKSSVQKTAATTPRKKKKKTEFSKKLCLLAVIVFASVAIYSVIAYYELMRIAIIKESMVSPDASVPITAITSIVASILSYCLYQFGLKNSRNKFGIDENGEPYARNEDHGM